MKDKITIGLFIDTFFPLIDGVVMVVDNYARKLSEYANVIVFCPRFSDKKYDDTVLPYKVVRCASFSFPTIDYYLSIPLIDNKFREEINKYKLDIVHIHSPFTIGEEGIRYAKKHNVPLIATLHSQFKQDFKRAVKSEVLSTKLTNILVKRFEKCDKLYAVNNEVRNIYLNEYGVKKEIDVTSNATDMVLIDKDDYINNKYKIEKDSKVFLFVGRINKLKNVFFIVDSLAKVKELDNNLKFKMIFVGIGQDLEDLKKVTKELNLSKDVIFAGKVTDRGILAKFYRRADLFLFPSFYDANSLVQIEAASQMTPTMFLEGSATSYNIKNDVDGFIVENDINSYAKKIIEVINDEKLLNKVSENAYKNVYKTWNDVVDKVYKDYIDLINGFKN